MSHSLRILVLPAALAASFSLALPAWAADAAPRNPATAAVLADAPHGTVLRDDDGGRVQIVPRHAAEARTPIDHGGPIVTRETLHLVYVGAAWQQNRPREEAIADELFARHRAGNELEDLVDPEGHHSISDLDVQHRLARLLEDDRGGELRKPGAVFVVFLAPGLQSTLGGHSSARDFAAYHNFLHLGGGVVRYVVVPYDEDATAWAAAARQSIVQALINPEGTGWY